MIYVIISLNDLVRFISGEERSFAENEGFFSTKSLSSTLEKGVSSRTPIRDLHRASYSVLGDPDTSEATDVVNKFRMTLREVFG